MRVASMIALLVACSSKPPAPAAPTLAPSPMAPVATGSAAPAVTPAVPTSSSSSVKVTLADVGIEGASLDRTMDPCVDFYQFACGGWIKANPIPPSYGAWHRLIELGERNLAVIHGMLEEASKAASADAATKKIGDFYAACMDEPAVDKAGLASIQPLLDKLKNVRDARSWQAAVTALHKIGTGVVWGTLAIADLKASTTNVTYIDSDGLGLPDRDFYVKPELKTTLDRYTTHVGKMLGLAGIAKPEAAAADVVALETELAKISKTSVEARDVNAAYNPTDARGLAQKVKSVDWPAYWKGLGVQPSAKIIVVSPKYFAALDGVRARIKPATWSSYFIYHLLQHSAFELPKAFDDEAFELTKLVGGAEQKRERYKRCVDATEAALGDIVAEHYVAKQFPGSSKQTATTLIDALVKALGDDIATLDWMSDATKPVAQAKLAKIVRRVGYPDKWRTYPFDVKRDDFAGNVRRASEFEVHRLMARAGHPVDRAEWDQNAFDADAGYTATSNSIEIPAGILQPPLFGQDRSIAANLGGIGYAIGHELTHAFDDQGAEFDSDGNLKPWWAKDDKAKFDERATCVADQYSTFEVLPKQFIQGRLTLGENIADMGGVKMAFRAYRALRRDAAKSYVADGYTEDQQFFIAAAQVWCANERPESVTTALTSNPHSPPKFRIYGALRNMREFADAFSCPAGTPMRPAKTCSVW
jgi:putative endopeptidase